MPPAVDANLDELKRKARRRLVGAIVLALAAAVFVPMLLESDERPLGNDVSVKIPPVDEDKFVNRLNSPAGKAAAPDPARSAAPAKTPPRATPSQGASGDKPAVDRAATAPAPSPDAGASAAKSLSDSEQRVLNGGNAPAASSAAPAAGSAPAGAADAGSAPATAGDAAAAPVNAAASAPKAAAPGGTSATGAKGAPGYVVQLAAFSDDKGANALAGRLKKSGHPAFTEPVTTSRGTLWRVRVGPYATRDEANAARDQLKREGQNGIVAARS
jgi:DedD protein